MKKTIYFGLFFLFIIILSGEANAFGESNLYIANGPEDDIEKITFTYEDERIPNGWYPLRELSNYLPIQVDWNEETRSVIVVSPILEEINNNLVYSEFTTEEIAYREDMIIVDGTTYCSPRFISSRLFSMSFRYNNELWFCDAEKDFNGKVKSVLLELKVKSPDNYEFVTNRLTGGIEVGYKYSEPGVLGYVYPYTENPVCYISRDTLSSWSLLRVIAHEAYHVEQARNGVEITEKDAKNYANSVIDICRQI